MHLRDNFNEGGPVSQVPASWFNRVAKFINNLIPGDGVSFEKHDDGSPTAIRVTAQGGEISGQINFISSVTWNGTQIVVGHSTATVSNGQFVITEGTSTAINTVTYNPS